VTRRLLSVSVSKPPLFLTFIRIVGAAAIAAIALGLLWRVLERTGRLP
jgi:hypothetical protein